MIAEVARFKNSSLKDLDVDQEKLIFQGGFYELAPVTITLSIVVLVQNIVIFLDYYKDRAKLVPSLFMGIALSDILKAQGELVLAVISILVYAGHVDIMVLYNSLFYYMITALPGINCSKMFNMVLTITFTLQVVNPFRRINTGRIRKIVLICCFVITFLHICDTVSGIVLHFTYFNDTDSYLYKMLYLFIAAVFDFPGSISGLAIGCILEQKYTNPVPFNTGHASICDPRNGRDKKFIGPSHLGIIGFSFYSMYIFGPVLVVMTCMILQIKHLRRSFQESGAETSPLLPNPTRHVSVTVFLISALFSVCHSAYFLVIAVWLYIHPVYNIVNDEDAQYFVKTGLVLGLAEFTLPLVYAAVYPIIIITRKQELRERYIGYFRRSVACFRSTISNG